MGGGGCCDGHLLNTFPFLFLQGQHVSHSFVFGIAVQFFYFLPSTFFVLCTKQRAHQSIFASGSYQQPVLFSFVFVVLGSGVCVSALLIGSPRIFHGQYSAWFMFVCTHDDWDGCALAFISLLCVAGHKIMSYINVCNCTKCVFFYIYICSCQTSTALNPMRRHPLPTPLRRPLLLRLPSWPFL